MCKNNWKSNYKNNWNKKKKITGTKLIMSYVVVLQMVFVPNLIHEYTLNQMLNNQPRIRNTGKGTAMPK